MTSQRPSGRSNAATAASPSKKISVSTIDHAPCGVLVADRKAGAVGGGGEGHYQQFVEGLEGRSFAPGYPQRPAEISQDQGATK